jgi:hypothetical protein
MAGHPRTGMVRTPDMASHTVPSAPLSTRYAARLVLAAAAVGAGVIHLAFAPEHLREYLPLGAGFVAAGLFQIGWGAALAVQESARLLLLGGLLSVGFIAVYLVTRTLGLPVGPDAFHPESVGVADVLCCALEVPVAFGALLLARRPGAMRSALGPQLFGVLAGGLLLVVSVTAVALAAPAHQHGAEASGCAPAPVLTGVRDARGVDTGVTTYFFCKLHHEHDGHPH